MTRAALPWLFCLLLGIVVGVIEAQEYRLIFSHVIYRHGDRAPSSTFPKDKYQEDYWPMGWGQLTPKGVREQFELGTYLRRRYSNYLSSNFSREEIYVRSSDRDRALESAQSNLAGLYPPPTRTDCNAWMDWRPIPIHAVAKENDYLLQTDADSICPEYQKVYQEQSSQYIAELNAKHAALFNFLKEQTGLQELSVSNQGGIHGAVSREKQLGWPVPEWVDRVWNQTTGETILDILAELNRIERMMEYNTPEKTKYMSGFLTGDILNRMKEKAAGKLKKPNKMVMYSAHEGTVLALLFGMDVADNRGVPYAGCVIIELHESTSNPSQHFVSVHYRNDTTREPFTLVPPGCLQSVQRDIYCPLETFERSVEKVVLYPETKFEEACGMNKCSGKHTSGANSRGYSVGGLTLVLGAVLQYLLGGK